MCETIFGFKAAFSGNHRPISGNQLALPFLFGRMSVGCEDGCIGLGLISVLQGPWSPKEPFSVILEPCVLFTQPRPPSFLPSPPQRVQATPYVIPPSLLGLKAEMPSSPAKTSRQLLLEECLERGSPKDEHSERSHQKPQVLLSVVSAETMSNGMKDSHEAIPSVFEDNTPAVTTVMMRNIPSRYTCEELLRELILAGFDRMFDFFYLPMDFKTKRNRGYGFINFQSPDIAKDFAQKFHHRHLRLHSSKKLLEVAPAITQGYEANVRKVTKELGRIKNSWFRPMFFQSSEACENN